MKKSSESKAEKLLAKQEERQANKAFNFIVAFGKRKDALVSLEEIPKEKQLKLFT